MDIRDAIVAAEADPRPSLNFLETSQP
jgi:hypothetical protein